MDTENSVGSPSSLHMHHTMPCRKKESRSVADFIVVESRVLDQSKKETGTSSASFYGGQGEAPHTRAAQSEASSSAAPPCTESS